jgi:predicted nuclease with TOPRIM domain
MTPDREEQRWILVEKMASDMKAVMEQTSQIQPMADRLERLEGKVDGVDTRLRSVEVRLTSVETDVKELKADMKEVKTYVAGHHEAIVELKATAHTHS